MGTTISWNIEEGNVLVLEYSGFCCFYITEQISWQVKK